MNRNHFSNELSKFEKRPNEEQIRDLCAILSSQAHFYIHQFYKNSIFGVGGEHLERVFLEKEGSTPQEAIAKIFEHLDKLVAGHKRFAIMKDIVVVSRNYNSFICKIEIWQETHAKV